jgi:hypothetical protein
MSRRRTFALGVGAAATVLVLLPLLAAAAPILYLTPPYVPNAVPLVGITNTASSVCSTYTVVVPPSFNVATGVALQNSQHAVTSTSTCTAGASYGQLIAGVQDIDFHFTGTGGAYTVTMSWTLTGSIQLSTSCAAPTVASAMAEVSLNGSMTDYTSVPPASIGSSTTIPYSGGVSTCGSGASYTPSNHVYTVTFPVTLSSGSNYHLSTAAWTTCEATLKGATAVGDYSHSYCDLGSKGSAVLSYVQIA